MRKYFPYLLYFVYWLLFFVIAKLVFLFYHATLSQTLNGTEIFNVFYYGLRMDISFTAYICIFPFLLFFLQSIFIKLSLNKVIYIYTIVLVIILSFVSAADLELYKAWGFRMDATPLQYFKTPQEMGATVSSSPVWLLLFVFLILAGVFIFIYKKYFYKRIGAKRIKFHFADLALSLFLIAILFVPIRGGIQKIPMNISDVYFSEKLFANHAAINLPWNIMFAILNKNDDHNPFDYLDKESAKEIVENVYNTGPARSPSILNVDQPNIIIIMLESFTAKLAGSLGGMQGVTPQLDSIAANGLSFTQIYAAGDRSEKALTSILSGYPNQGITSIIKTPNKTMHLPGLSQALEQQGYVTSFTYGGELEFANIKSYLLNTGFDKLTDKYSFPLAQRTTSWGVHDEYVFDYFLSELSAKKSPFFSMLFTLSSHEPYDVPAKHFTGKDILSQFKNSVFYTDSLLGEFINKSRTAPWWQNTLIVIVADHGHPLPGNDANDLPSKFHIPLVFTGGALQLKGTINTIGSQTDIAATLLNQLNISSEKFKWSKDLLDSSAGSFAFYSFNNGFGIVTPTGTGTMDNISKQVIYKDPNFDTGYFKLGKAYMQYSYEDFLKR